MRKVGEALDATSDLKIALIAITLSLSDIINSTSNIWNIKMSKKEPEIADAHFPPLSPTDEQRAPNDPAFVKACLSQLDQINGLGHIQAGSDFLTVSKTWGLTFRVDFTIGDQPDGDLLNRLVCWRQKNGQIGTVYAMGQAMTPLPS